MFVNKALRDINQSAQSFSKNNESAGVSGFAERLVKQYGKKTVIRAVDMSTLTPLQAGWVKRWIVDKAKK